MQIRLQGGKGLYYDCLRRYLQEGEDAALRARISAFLADLTHWRNEVRNFSLHELLRLLYRETGYYDYLSVTAGGTLRQANLRLLLEKAEQYEKGSHRGLFYFIRYVEDMKTAEAETSSAKLPTEGEDRMQVMTIHKSKGLEFPVVFVADMGKSFMSMIPQSVLLAPEMGLRYGLYGYRKTGFLPHTGKACAGRGNQGGKPCRGAARALCGTDARKGKADSDGNGEGF